MYTQNKEEAYITKFFGEHKGILLDIGANDGKTFSNSLRLIELGWSAVLVEPSPACVEKLQLLHGPNPRVLIAQCAIGAKTEMAEFHESGALIVPEIGPDNVSLVSTLIPSEKERWNPLNMQWTKYPVKVYSWEDFGKKWGRMYDFISIDAEGVDLIILKQMNLSNVKLLCVEWNCVQTVRQEMLDYISKFGPYEIIYETGENLLIARQ